jgi:hypothetical protein
VLETASHHKDGTPAFTTSASLFIRGEGGWGGPCDPESQLATLPLPAREHDEVVTYTKRPDDAPILHGLRTYGFTGAPSCTSCASPTRRVSAPCGLACLSRDRV